MKLVRMIPEVYEVFELLEFHYILKAFDTLEEAVSDFERLLSNGSKQTNVVEVNTTEPKSATPVADKEIKTTQSDQPIRTDLSIEDKVKKIVTTHPNSSTLNIARMLNTPQYGNVKIGWFGLRKILKKIDLDSKKKRQIFSVNYS